MKAWFFGLLCCLCGPALLADGYLDLGDIEGDSMAQDFEGWIVLEDLDSLIEVLDTQINDRRSVVYDPIVLSKKVDKASPLLAEAVATGQVIPSARIVATRAGGSMQVYYELELGNVSISRWEMGGDFEADQLSESFAVSYETVGWVYRLLGDDGALLERVSASWDIELGVGGVDSDGAPSIDPIADVPASPGDMVDVPIRIVDTDTEIEKVKVEVTTRTPTLLRDLKVIGDGVDRTVRFQTSKLLTGMGSVLVSIDDGRYRTSRAFTVLVGAEATPFEAYLAAYLTPEELKDPELVSPLGDPDGDGLVTLLEYYFSTPMNLFTSQDEVLSYEVKKDGNDLLGMLRYRHRKDPQVSAKLLHSTNLEDWVELEVGRVESPLYMEKVVESSSPFFQEVEGEVLLKEAGKSFLRFEVEAVF